MHAQKKFEVVQLNQLPEIECPCGIARRAFSDLPEAPCSVHLVFIENDAKRHFHKQMTEIYVVLEGEGSLELDDAIIPMKPFTTVMIKPGCRHRAIGTLKILNIAIPKFDPTDEFAG